MVIHIHHTGGRADHATVLRPVQPRPRRRLRRWGVFFGPDDVFVWVKRDVTAEKIAEAVAEVLNAVIPYERDTHAQAQELRRKLGPISDF